MTLKTLNLSEKFYNLYVLLDVQCLTGIEAKNAH